MKPFLIIIMFALLLILIVGCGKKEEIVNDIQQNLPTSKEIPEEKIVYEDFFNIEDVRDYELSNPKTIKMFEKEDTYVLLDGRRYKFTLDKILNYSVNFYINDYLEYVSYNHEYNYKNKLTIVPLPKKYVVNIPSRYKRVKLFIGTEKGLSIIWMKEGELKKFNIGGRLNKLKVGVILEGAGTSIDFYDGSNERRFKLLPKEVQYFGQEGFIYVADILTEDEEFVTRNMVEFNLTTR